ncbi:DUF2207 domain-containing protein [Candidatus Berkelbacteria bacterium]|nr:DUF2207 domain-containing protein [Candidatus Berkelbacteria bacterium]
MRRFLTILFAGLSTLLPVDAQALEAFIITQFQTDITVEKTSGIIVHETIAVDFDSNQRHGIYRTIPTKFKTNAGANRSTRLTDVDVELNDQAVPFEVSRRWGGTVEVKIGDPDILVTGPQTYELTYHIDNALNFFDDHAELYWNATGTEWATSITAASSIVTLPAGSGDLRGTAYQGYYGSTEAAEASASGNTFTFRSTRPLDEYEGLTIVAGWPLGLVTPPSTWTKAWWLLADNAILLLPVLVFIWILLHFRRHGKDPLGRRTIVPEFAPPKGLSLLEQAALRDERLQGRDLTAMIIGWAVDGFVTIAEPKRGQYELTKKKDLTGRPAEELAFFTKIFGQKKTVALKDIQRTLADAASKLRSSVFSRLVDRQYFTKNPESVRTVYIVIGVILMIGSLWIGLPFGLLTFAAIFATGLMLLIAAPFMPKRTKQGVELKQKIDGFQLYLKTAERYRLQFAENEKLFERYLPYAIAFGVATLWAKAFGDIAKTAPSWYSGYYTSHWSSTDFARGMESGFSGSVNNAIMTASSGGSGFSGGGSGGGFGGGGGGSW